MNLVKLSKKIDFIINIIDFFIFLFIFDATKFKLTYVNMFFTTYISLALYRHLFFKFHTTLLLIFVCNHTSMGQTNFPSIRPQVQKSTLNHLAALNVSMSSRTRVLQSVRTNRYLDVLVAEKNTGIVQKKSLSTLVQEEVVLIIANDGQSQFNISNNQKIYKTCLRLNLNYHLGHFFSKV